MISMENGKNSPTTNIEDTLLVAFMVFKGHQIKEWKDAEGHVSFDILGEPAKIQADMADYYDANYCVSITEFVRCFKEVKSRMYNFKNLNVTKKEKE
jgi:hypothetical protein